MGEEPLANEDDSEIDLTIQEYGDTTLWQLVGDYDRAEVRAYIVGATRVEANGLTLTADATQTIDAIVVAGAVALTGGGAGVSVSGAGVYAENRIATDVKAFVDGDDATTPAIETVTVDVGSIAITATDASGINAVAGAAAIAAAIGGVGVAVSIGLSIAINEVANDVAAFIAHATVDSDGDIVLSAKSEGRKVFDLTTTAADDWAADLDNAATAAPDDPNTPADEAADDRDDDADILANLADAFTGDNALTFAHRFTSDESEAQTVNPGDAVLVAAGHTAGGTPGLVYRYTGEDPADDLALSGVDYTDADWERVLPTVSAIEAGSSWMVVAGDDVWVLTRVDDAIVVSRPTIGAVTVAASVAAGLGAIGVAVSGAGAVAENTVLSTAKAYIDSSVIGTTDDPVGNIDLDAASTASVIATVAAASAAIGIGVTGAGVGASIGISVARNIIGGPNPVDSVIPEVGAFLRDTSVTASGALTLDAAGGQGDRCPRGRDVGGCWRGCRRGHRLQRCGRVGRNTIAADVQAFIAATTTATVSAASVALSASDASAIAALAGSASLAAGIGTVGAAISVGVTLARNTVTSDVAAYVTNVAVTATGALGITLAATNAASITVIAAAASVAVGGGLVGIGISGAGADAANIILTRTTGTRRARRSPPPASSRSRPRPPPPLTPSWVQPRPQSARASWAPGRPSAPRSPATRSAGCPPR